MLIISMSTIVVSAIILALYPHIVGMFHIGMALFDPFWILFWQRKELIRAFMVIYLFIKLSMSCVALLRNVCMFV